MSRDVGFDMNAEILIARAHQLAKMEADKIHDKVTSKIPQYLFTFDILPFQIHAVLTLLIEVVGGLSCQNEKCPT